MLYDSGQAATMKLGVDVTRGDLLVGLVLHNETVVAASHCYCHAHSLWI
jgi:hypothetical protein